MKEVWREIMSGFDPILIKNIIKLGFFIFLLTLGLLYVFS